MKPEKNEYGEYYERYIGLVQNANLIDALKQSEPASYSFWNSISEEHACFRYAKDKWSIKELLQHIIDTERIFSYRALSFARGESIDLPGYDENAYADNCFADSRPYENMVNELLTLRKSTIQLFASFREESLCEMGNASNSPLSSRAAGFIIVGHEIHHISIVKERYLSAL